MDISNLTKKHDVAGTKWFDDVPDHDGLRLCVRSTNYKPYKDAMKQLGLKHNKKISRGEGGELAGKVMAEHLLVGFDAKGWTGLTNAGKPLEYSKETALTLMTAEDDLGICAAFQSAVFECAKDFADEQRKSAEAVAGN